MSWDVMADDQSQWHQWTQTENVKFGRWEADKKKRPQEYVNYTGLKGRSDGVKSQVFRTLFVWQKYGPTNKWFKEQVPGLENRTYVWYV